MRMIQMNTNGTRLLNCYIVTLFFNNLTIQQFNNSFFDFCAYFFGFFVPYTLLLLILPATLSVSNTPRTMV